MKKMDNDGLILCRLQGEIFERSADVYPSSSPVFIRRFMRSELAGRMDTAGFLDRPFYKDDAFEEIDDEYGKTDYGKNKFTGEELFWMGYIYRYWSYIYDMPSVRAYRIIPSRELRELYLAYHTLDPAHAVARILEAKGIATEEEAIIKRGVEIMRRIRLTKQDA